MVLPGLPVRLQPHNFSAVPHHQISLPSELPTEETPAPTYRPLQLVQHVWLHQHPLHSDTLTNTLVQKDSKTHSRVLLTVSTHMLTLVHTLTHVAHTYHSYTNKDTHILLYRHACTFPYTFPQGFGNVHACSHTDASLHITHIHTHHTPLCHTHINTHTHAHHTHIPHTTHIHTVPHTHTHRTTPYHICHLSQW